MREYVDGHSLRIELERQGQSPLPIDFIQQVFAAVGDAMIFAQELGVTDIDIKPENIIIQRMQVKLNLGLSSNYRIMLSPETGDKEMLGKREYLKFFISNIVYFPPELFNASNVYSNSTDPEKVNQYRLGMLGYEMLSASEQFKREAETRSKTLAGSTLPAGSVMFTVWPPVETMRREGCPKFISLAIDRMIAPDPKDRFQTLSEAVNAVAYRNLSVEVARDSYRRILNDYKKETEFFRTFYRCLPWCISIVFWITAPPLRSTSRTRGFQVEVPLMSLRLEIQVGDGRSNSRFSKKQLSYYLHLTYSMSHKNRLSWIALPGNTCTTLLSSTTHF